MNPHMWYVVIFLVFLGFIVVATVFVETEKDEWFRDQIILRRMYAAAPSPPSGDQVLAEWGKKVMSAADEEAILAVGPPPDGAMAYFQKASSTPYERYMQAEQGRYPG